MDLIFAKEGVFHVVFQESCLSSLVFDAIAGQSLLEGKPNQSENFEGFTRDQLTTACLSHLSSIFLLIFTRGITIIFSSGYSFPLPG
jgi:hypothetical protein